MISVDINRVTDFTRLVREVNQSKTPRKLIQGNETIAILMPVAASSIPRKRQGKTPADYKAFRASAGSWKEVDTQALKNAIVTDRQKRNIRPPVEL